MQYSVDVNHPHCVVVHAGRRQDVYIPNTQIGVVASIVHSVGHYSKIRCGASGRGARHNR